MLESVLLRQPGGNKAAIRRVTQFDSTMVLLEALSDLKRFTANENLLVRDFNILFALLKEGEPQTANSPGALACVPSLLQATLMNRQTVNNGLKVLQERGFIFKSERNNRSHWSVNTYHLTKAGRDLIKSFFDYREELVILKRKELAGKFVGNS